MSARPNQSLWHVLWEDESGQNYVEYVILTALFAITAALVLTQLDEAVDISFTGTTSDLTNPVSPPE